jgi:hypothetical protein
VIHPPAHLSPLPSCSSGDEIPSRW